jgi:hypothetical protein
MFMSMTLDTLPERPSYIRDADQWEAACQRNGAILLPCGICDYHGEVPWDPVMAESGQWHCPQCDRLRPYLDFGLLWLAPGRKIQYHGSIDLLARGWPERRDVVPMARVWRRCDDDPSPHFLHSDPEIAGRGDFHWGLRRYPSDRLLALNLAFAIMHDFYGWLSWAEAEIAYEPYSRKRWAEEHADAFLNEVIAHLPHNAAWTLDDDAMRAALRQIAPASFRDTDLAR